MGKSWLQIDMLALREIYNREEVTRLGLDAGRSNIVDVMTKEMLSNKSLLWQQMTADKIA